MWDEGVNALHERPTVDIVAHRKNPIIKEKTRIWAHTDLTPAKKKKQT